MHLTAVNLQNRRPSTISTSKITHVTENRDWFRVNNKGNHTTNIGAILWETITDIVRNNNQLLSLRLKKL